MNNLKSYDSGEYDQLEKFYSTNETIEGNNTMME